MKYATNTNTNTSTSTTNTSRSNTSTNNHSNVQQAHRVVEITIGTDPQSLVDQAVADVRHDGLRRVLDLCCSATEVRQVLTSLLSPSPGYIVSPVQRLRRAAQTARLWWAFGAQEGEVLYVSTFIQGCQDLLAASTDGFESAQERMFAIIRPALFKLDEHHPRQAWLLRQALGRGNVDEEDEQEAPRLRESVRRALLASRQTGRHGAQVVAQADVCN